MKKAVRWGGVVTALVIVGVGLVAAFLVSFADAQVGLHERQFARLFWINVVVALLLAGVLVLVGLRLYLRFRQGRFGSRLLLKLAATFALVGVLPGAVIYAVSWQFAVRSLESWFDERMAQALDAGLSLGRGMLESMQSDLGGKAQMAALRLAEGSDLVSPLALERVREQLGASEVSLVGPSGQVLSTAGGGGVAGWAAQRPPATLLREARAGRVASQIDGLDDPSGDAQLRVLVPMPSAEISLRAPQSRFLLVVQPLQRSLAANALAVQAAYSEYQERALARDALRRMVIGTLTLAGVLAVFGAVLLAILLGNQITRPLLMLADGVREVSAGNLAARPVFPSSDELGGLTRSFALMTRQVFEAREQVQRGVGELEAARARLQTILDNLTAGVIVLGNDGAIETVNPGAVRILGAALAGHAGQPLSAVPGLAEFSQAVGARFQGLVSSPEPGGHEPWQEALELHPGQAGALTLLARGALLPGGGMLLVFDDITEVVSAQRAQAWAEVARRLAHEIKNPLTPIQLSAERLQHKLESRLEGADQAMLVRGVATIVDQVEAMKRMVNEFRDYARLPTAQPAPLALNSLVSDVLALYGQMQEAGVLRAQLAGGLPDILGDGSQLRQVVHNLVQNALDAVADRSDAVVTVITEAVRDDADGSITAVRLAVEDNGGGIPEAVMKRAFEPYVTTKPRGTGLGLALVKKIADEHRARVRLRNRHQGDRPDAPVIGARVSISFFALMPARLPSASSPASPPTSAAA